MHYFCLVSSQHDSKSSFCSFFMKLLLFFPLGSLFLFILLAFLYKRAAGTLIVFALSGLSDGAVDTNGGIRYACRQYDCYDDILYHKHR